MLLDCPAPDYKPANDYMEVTGGASASGDRIVSMKMEDMRGVLRGSLGRSLAAFTETDRLAAAWPVVCGSAMAAHGEVTGFFEGTVTVAVTDAAWMSQMMSLRGVLEHELARVARVKVTAIHFEMELKKR